VVPGAVTTVAPPEPFASFVTRLVAGEVVVKRIPGRLNGTWPDGGERDDPEEIELGVDVAQAMPGAVSPLELAPRVWLVNTTGRRDVLLEAAGLLFVLGFNLVMASDDPDGPVETTELHWWGPDEQRAVAEHVREGLEFGVILEDGDVIEGLDMAIHLGRDWSERIDELAASRTTTTTLARTTTTTVRSSGSGGTTPRPSPATTSGTTVAPTSTVESSSSTTEGEEPSASTTPDATATTVPSTSGTATSVSPTTSTVDAPTTST